MIKFAPILNRPWTNSSINTATINGYWAEDDSNYQIKAPPQLVDSIIAMQNYVFDMYKEIGDREKSIAKLTKELNEYKIARGYKE